MKKITSTQIYKGRSGWEGNSMSEADANGKAWQITNNEIYIVPIYSETETVNQEEPEETVNEKQLNLFT